MTTKNISNPKFVIKITKPSGVVLRRHSSFKRRTLSFCQRKFSPGDSIHLMVIYKPGIHNEGVYTDLKEFTHAWEQFTEEDLIKDALTY